MALYVSSVGARRLLLALAATVLVGTALGAGQNPGAQPAAGSPPAAPRPATQASPPATPASLELFEARVRPLLAANCFACHSQSAMAGLRVDSREGLLKGGETGPALVPGDPENSTLLKVIQHTEGFPRMPRGRAKLPADDIEAVAEWIKAGWEKGGVMGGGGGWGGVGEGWWVGGGGLLERCGERREHALRVKRKVGGEQRGARVKSSRGVRCHSQSAMAGLRVDSREGLLRGGETGPAIVPGDPEKSTLLKVVQHAEGFPRMPRGRAKLPAADIEALAEWIKGGAVWPGTGETTAAAPTGSREGHHAGAASVLGVPAAGQPRGTRGGQRRMAADRHRSLHPRAARKRRTVPGRARRQAHAAAPRHARSDRPAADAGGSRRLPERRVARRVREGRRPAARLAALRRSLGPHLARRGPLRRGRLPQPRSDGPRLQPLPQRAPLSRLGDPRLQRRPAVRPVRHRAARGRPARRAGAPAAPARARVPRPRARGTTTTARWRSCAPTSATIASMPSAAACSASRSAARAATITSTTRSRPRTTTRSAGVFLNTEYHEYPLAPKAIVAEHKAKEEELEQKREMLRDYTNTEAQQLAGTLAFQAAKYMKAAWQVTGEPKKEKAEIIEKEKLDYELFDRWLAFLERKPTFYPYLKDWQAMIAHGRHGQGSRDARHRVPGADRQRAARRARAEEGERHHQGAGAADDASRRSPPTSPTSSRPTTTSAPAAASSCAA